MRRRILPWFVAFALMATIIPLTSLSSPAAVTVSTDFNLTAPGAGPTLALTGQDHCQVTLFAPAAGAQLTPQVTAGTVWSAVSTIAGGSVTAPGTYYGAVDGTSNTSFRVYVTALGAAISGRETCSTGVAAAVYSASDASLHSLALSTPLSVANGGTGTTTTPSPAPAASPCNSLTSKCVGLYATMPPTPDVGNAFVQYMKISQNLNSTNNDLAGPNTITGNTSFDSGGVTDFVCTNANANLRVESVVDNHEWGFCIETTQTPTDALNIVNVGTGTVLRIPPTILPTLAPLCLTGAVPTLSTSCNTYDATILAETSATHFWNNLGGGACATAADAIGGGATAAPSPVPLPTVSPGPLCGAAGIIKDGTFSAAFTNGNVLTASGYYAIPNGTLPLVSAAFSVECVFTGAGITNAHMGFFENDASNGVTLDVFASATANTANELEAKTASSTTDTITPIAGGSNIVVDYVWNGSNQVLYYINGIVVNTGGGTPSFTAANGSIGFGNAQVFNGRVQKCATFNAALTAAQISAHYSASGLP